MLNVAIIGASGYAGADLSLLVAKHPELNLNGIYVSENSADGNKLLSELYPRLRGMVDKTLTPLTNEALEEVKKNDIVCLATEHVVSMKLAPTLIDAGCVVFDLSGAYRVNDAAFYPEFYGFEHENLSYLQQAVYGLAEWNKEEIKKTNLIAVAGCYPTASLSALKPLAVNGLIKKDSMPIINAVSGVTGAGRKAKLSSSFCEVSLNAYGVFKHRHRPEISHHLGQKVLFQPHLGNFKRGILATIYVELADNVTDEMIDKAYHSKYDNQKIVRLVNHWPAVKDVEFTPYCDIHYQREDNTLVICSAIDNLQKGAAAHAMQCINIRFGFEETTSLI
ncbi:MAG: N-acetyl-gamma-glutamyl-phosphate reductase [Succinivibrionaceae bacterium]|nr:N-acetyl-gamma-glutamyl-phosphate reductase [Ruminobacter sp.]MDY5778957.1 N-acetyl-gamma-glutamyl-phosphate reductase [Succinivibrionaceae bacterium]MEE1339691.1 N-acetyl-gamma-glutamyl-phosphate reductase [Succinivibrionaceae bacterium]